MMRSHAWCWCWLGLVVAVGAQAAPPEERYSIRADREAYPQATPEEALASVIKAVQAGRVDYVLAHLAEPAWVDEQVKSRHGGDFKRAVADAAIQLGPYNVKLLGRFQEKGKWKVEKDKAVLTFDEVKDKVVSFKKIDGQWYMQHRRTP